MKEKSKNSDNVGYVPEIVINGINAEALEEAMREGITTVLEDEDVLMVSAGNYEGQLGDHKIYLTGIV